MVATAGAGWRLSPCLALLVTESDLRFPGRSRIADGSIGDTAHASRTSDHNPTDGWVDAVDLTDDDAAGCDVGLLFAHLLATRDPRVKYMIHKGSIVKSYTSTTGPAWTPLVYTGPNAHTQHLHVSCTTTGRFSTAAWWPTPTQPEDDMTPEQEAKIDRLEALLKEAVIDTRAIEPRSKETTIIVRDLAKRVAAIEAKLG